MVRRMAIYLAIGGVLIYNTPLADVWTTGRVLVVSNLRRYWKRWFEALKYATIGWLVVSGIWHSKQVKERQSLDATSEWSRFASDPAARGRAVGMLLIRLLPYWIGAKLARRDSTTVKQLTHKAGVLFANSLLKLGPLYIKLGQIVSNQERWLPSQWIEALERLQDKVPAHNGTKALDLAYNAMGSKERFDEVFSEFDTTPLAAASLGQVHKARLRKNGNVVAVKLQRPHLREIYDKDLAMFKTIAAMMDKMGSRAQVGGVSQSWTKIFDDAKTILYREIDYRDEAENGLRIAHDFGITVGGQESTPTALAKDGNPLTSASSWLRVPYVYKDLSSEKALVMEFVPSIKITDKKALDAANVSMDDRAYLADCLARAYLRSFCSNGFFSTDPHAGNLGVEVTTAKEGRTKPRLVLYDFGQACELQKDQSDGILSVMEAVIDTDTDRCVEAFRRMGVLQPDADVNKVRAKVRDNFETGKIKIKRSKLRNKGYVFHSSQKATTKTATTPVKNADVTTEKVKDADVMKFFTLPAEYAFVARALTQMDGVGKTLDADFDFISSAAPYIVEIKGASNYISEEVSKRIQGLQKKVTEVFQHRGAEASS